MPNPKTPGAGPAAGREGEPAPRLGEGISRTSEPNTKLFRLRVEFASSLPLVETIRARTPKQAQKFARNRYPGATVVTLLVEPSKRRFRNRVLGEEINPGQLVYCPRCQRSHRVMEPTEDGQRLLYVKCQDRLKVIGLENRYLPQVN
jgi:hypothetical protein